MSREHHTWKADRDPPLIRAHSLAKHRILGSYLERYVSVLTANPRQKQLRLSLIDGFAGGGKYRDERTKEIRPGSPLIMLNSMRNAHAAARELRTSKEFNLDVDYFFVEANRDAAAYLRTVISESEYRDLLDDRIRIIRGEFVPEVQRVIDFVKQRGRAERAIFVLDQCGYLDAPLPTIRKILAELDNAEVILTFATDFLIDYLNGSDETQRRIQQLGLSLPSPTIQDAKVQQDWRRVIQFVLHKEIPEKTGAEFYTPFFLRSVDSDRDFWLIHLSGHHRARDVMVGLHWQVSNSFAHFGRAGLNMLGYDPERDPQLTRQNLLPGFYFDQNALAISQEELLQQLPQRLYNFPKGIPFDEFFARLTNESPVTQDIMKGVISELARQKIIEVRDSSGSMRRSGIQQRTDILIPSRQKRFPRQ